MWIFFGLVAPLVYTVVNFIDKYLLSKSFKDYRGLPVYTALVSFCFGLAIWIVTGFSLLSFRDGVIIITTGVITLWSIVIYYKALSREETSNVILYFQLIPLFSIFFALFFLGERLSGKQMIGFFVVLFGSLLAVINPKSWNWRLPESFLLILLFDLMTALAGFLMKFVLNTQSFLTVFSYESFGIGVGGLILYLAVPSIRTSFLKSRKRQKKKTLFLIVLNESVFVTAKSSMYYAFALGPLALVSVLGNTQVFFGILFGFVLTFLFPKIFRESIEKGTLTLKLISAVVLFAGLYLIL